MTGLTLPDSALASAVRGLPRNALAASRMAALERFQAQGFPSPRLEDWKYTDLGAVVDISRRWLESGAKAPANDAVHDRVEAVVAAIDADWLVIANGTIAPLRPDIPGTTFETLGDLRKLPGDRRPLDDFNAALLVDGLRIRITSRRKPDRPLGLLIVDAAGGQPAVSQVRVEIDVTENAQAQIIEYHTSVGGSEQYANAVIDCRLSGAATADYVRIQDRAFDHDQTQRTAVRLAAGSTFDYCGFDLGGRLVRNDLDVDIAGRDARAAVNGLYIVGEGQHIDNHVRIDHRSGPARSAQAFRGILGGRCRGVWNGKTIVHAGADGTDAEQGNHNLLLSERSEIDAKPELEIYADDVKCSHGTTVGQLDEAALFYLRSRGLDRSEAARALTRAFGASIVNSVPFAALGELLTDRIESRLSQLSGKDVP